MASKSHFSIPISAPPQISLTDQLLSSRLSLPPDPCVAYALFTPNSRSTLKPHESIELARRNILSRNASSVLLESLLSSIHIGTSPFIYVFLTSAQGHIVDATSTLATLHFDGLTSEYYCNLSVLLSPRSGTLCRTVIFRVTLTLMFIQSHPSL